jgi:hypothetical protein
MPFGRITLSGQLALSLPVAKPEADDFYSISLSRIAQIACIASASSSPSQLTSTRSMQLTLTERISMMLLAFPLFQSFSIRILDRKVFAVFITLAAGRACKPHLHFTTTELFCILIPVSSEGRQGR